MKSETKKDPAVFVESNTYVERLVIHYKKKISFFPEISQEEEGDYNAGFYKELIEEVKNSVKSARYYFLINEKGGIIYLIVKGDTAGIDVADSSSNADLLSPTHAHLGKGNAPVLQLFRDGTDAAAHIQQCSQRVGQQRAHDPFLDINDVFSAGRIATILSFLRFHMPSFRRRI